MLGGWHFGSKMTFLCHLTWWLTTFSCNQQGWLTSSNLTYSFDFSLFSCILRWQSRHDLGANSSKMEEPNVDERKRPMGFYTSTTIMQGISKGVHKHILGHVMDLTYLTWIFSLCWAEQIWFAQSFPPIHPFSTFVTPTFGSTMLVQGVGRHGGIFGIYGIKDLWVMGRRFLMWGCQGILVLRHILYNNHRFYIQH
jgi:hypothetical protein